MYGDSEMEGTFVTHAVNITSLDVGSAAKLGLIVYEYKEEDKLGFIVGNSRKYFCSPQYINSTEGCSVETVEKPIFKAGSKPEDMSMSWKLFNSTGSLKFKVQSKGFYCVVGESFSEDIYELDVNWNNYFGLLPSHYYPILITNGVMCAIYFAILLLWSFLSFKYWNEILRVQNYVSLVIFIALVESLFQYWYYRYYNSHGITSNPLMVFMVISSAIRSSGSLFLLLIVSMGYGVVKPTLGNIMNKVYALTYTHFVLITINEIGSIVMDRSQDFLLFLIGIPAALAYTVFFTWIVSSLKRTKIELENKRQKVKLEMYEKLVQSLTLCFAVAVVFMFTTLIIIAIYLGDKSWLSRHWSNIWILSDGWPKFLYFLGLMTIAYLLRPRENNSRYGLEQLGTEAPEDHRNDSIQLEVIVDNRQDEGANDNWAEENLGVTSDDDDE